MLCSQILQATYRLRGRFGNCICTPPSARTELFGPSDPRDSG
jgi:hypothetical protein